MISPSSDFKPSEINETLMTVNNFKFLKEEASIKNHEGRKYLVVKKLDNGEFVSSLTDEKKNCSSFEDITHCVEKMLVHQKLNVEQKKEILQGYRVIVEDSKTELAQHLSKNLLGFSSTEKSLIHLLAEEKMPVSEEELFSTFEIKDQHGEKFSLSGFEKLQLIDNSPFFKALWTGGFREQISGDPTSITLDVSDPNYSTQEIFQTLLKSLDDPKILTENKENFLLFASAAFQWEFNTEQVNKLLNDLLIESITDKNDENILTLLNFFSLNPHAEINNLAQSYISGWLNKEIGKESFLDTVKLLKQSSCPFLFNFSDSLISDEELASLKDLNLKSLILTNCKGITDKGLKQIANCVNLEDLSLKGCSKITDEGMRFIKNFSKLKYLDLSDCPQITDKGVVHFRWLKSLEYLDLGPHAQITDEGLVAIKKLTNLEYLVLNRLAFSDEGLLALNELKKMKSLILCRNAITEKGLKVIENFSLLEHLDLSTCSYLSDGALYHLKNAKKLRILNLTFCNLISDQELSYIRELSDLRGLTLDFCSHITDEGINQIKELKELQFLSLRDCNQITDAGLLLLQELKNLSYLDVSNCTQISEQGVKVLKDANVDVRHEEWN